MPERMALQPTVGIAEYFVNVERPNDKCENQSSPRDLEKKVVDDKRSSFAQAVLRQQRGKNDEAKNITPQRRHKSEYGGLPHQSVSPRREPRVSTDG